MNRLSLITFLLLITILPLNAKTHNKPAVIITTDGEVDDKSSFVRFLLYTADIDLKGIVATNSKWQKNGHGTEWILEAIDLYGLVRKNLIIHNSNYPTVKFLKSVTVLGNENPKYLKGSPPYQDSEGSNLILNELLNNKTTTLHVNCWGGANTVAQAIWRLKTDYKQKFQEAISKIRIYSISFQDEAGDWIKDNIPEAMIIEAGSWYLTWNYHKNEPLKNNPYPEYMSKEWLDENVKSNHGPLGEWYPQGNISEGDTPSFLNFVDNGLMAYEDYSLGGWGGRFEPKAGNYWIDAKDDNNDKKTLWRWCNVTQNDFAARMDWCVKSFENANHPPSIDLCTQTKIVSPDEKVELSAVASDIDNDKVFYYWWHYKDASNMNNYINIIDATSVNASFIVPSHTNSDIHIILEVKDDGEPSLVRYKRLIFKIK